MTQAVAVIVELKPVALSLSLGDAASSQRVSTDSCF